VSAAFTLAIVVIAYECQLMPHFAINGTQLYYECEGVGWPLLLIHGLGLPHPDQAPKRQRVIDVIGANPTRAYLATAARAGRLECARARWPVARAHAGHRRRIRTTRRWQPGAPSCSIFHKLAWS